MRYSRLCSKTTFNTPHDANSKNAEYLIQGGFIHQVAAGIYNFLPLGLRSLRKINQIIREEMDKIDGQEIAMPLLHPRDLWKKTGRDTTMDEILFRTNGTDNKDYLLSPSHEETVTPLIQSYVKSYKHLPVSVYQIQTKFRNEARAKSGVLRGREFGMKDMYSFHETQEDLDQYYEKVKAAYLRIYERCGLKAYVVKASGGAFSDQYSHEFAVLTPAGEDTILICEKTQEAQNLEVATGKIPEFQSQEAEKPMQQMPCERELSIQASANAHDVETSKVLKTVVYEVKGGGLIGVCIRGDLNINEHKLTQHLKAEVRVAPNQKVTAAGLVPGFISPVDNDKIPFIGDHSIKSVKNYVTGANQDQIDLINVNQGRDFTITEIIDLVQVDERFTCSTSGEPLVAHKGIEAGNIFKLGTIYSQACNFKITNREGQQQYPIMGCYGIGNTRLLGTVVEACHDEKGIIWPKSIAPYQVHLISIGKEGSDAVQKADEIYNQLQNEGIDVLYDDTSESAGKKFNNADLIGIPVRIVISSRTLEAESSEWKERSKEEAESVALADITSKVKQFYS